MDLGECFLTDQQTFAYREFSLVPRTLFHCCPCLVLGAVDGFGRMFPHGSTDFCLSGIFFSAEDAFSLLPLFGLRCGRWIWANVSSRINRLLLIGNFL